MIGISSRQGLFVDQQVEQLVEFIQVLSLLFNKSVSLRNFVEATSASMIKY